MLRNIFAVWHSFLSLLQLGGNFVVSWGSKVCHPCSPSCVLFGSPWTFLEHERRKRKRRAKKKVGYSSYISNGHSRWKKTTLDRVGFCMWLHWHFARWQREREREREREKERSDKQITPTPWNRPNTTGMLTYGKPMVCHTIYIHIYVNGVDGMCRTIWICPFHIQTIFYISHGVQHMNFSLSYTNHIL